MRMSGRAGVAGKYTRKLQSEQCCEEQVHMKDAARCFMQKKKADATNN
jgi:hypothetical protein